MTTLEKYVWVVNALYRAGKRGLSLKELNEKWIRDENVSKGEPLPRQTFDRWKGNILMSFGVNIECHMHGGYRYYIENPDSLRNGELSRWLLDTYSTANVLAQSTQLRDRILVEETPSSREFLTDIIEAMKDNRVMTITHKNFKHTQSFTFPVAPYCLKMFQKRWYMLALSINENRIRIYGLDRIEEAQVTDERFTLPKDFDAREHFSSYFGIVLDEDMPVQRVVLRADKYHQHYMRTLPLHESQREIFTCDDYADFELNLRPTFDLCMELLRVGSKVEVIEPQTLRHDMHCWIKDLWEMYEND